MSQGVIGAASLLAGVASYVFPNQYDAVAGAVLEGVEGAVSAVETAIEGPANAVGAATEAVGEALDEIGGPTLGEKATR